VRLTLRKAADYLGMGLHDTRVAIDLQEMRTSSGMPCQDLKDRVALENARAGGWASYAREMHNTDRQARTVIDVLDNHRAVSGQNNAQAGRAKRATDNDKSRGCNKIDFIVSQRSKSSHQSDAGIACQQQQRARSQWHPCLYD
jgi:hypothetical protein